MVSNPKKLRIGVAGYGRMGKRHARNVAFYTPRAELIAIAEPKESEHEHAKTNLPGVQLCTSTEEMLQLPGLDAILISTETAAHAVLALKAIKAGKHVLTEKPISISLEESERVVEAAC